MSRARVVGLGVGAALAVALPAALLAQLADAVDDGDSTPGIAYPLVVVVLVGMVAGGWVVGRQAPRPSPLVAGLAGLVAMGAVQALGVARRAAGDDDIAWGTVPGVLLLGVTLAIAGAALAGSLAW